MEWKVILTNLLKVKSIITILTTLVFCWLLITGAAISQEFMMIYTVIIAFYFGTQTQKNKDGVSDGYSGQISQGDSGTDN